MRQNKAIMIMRLSMNEAELKNVNTKKAANKISTVPTIKKGPAILKKCGGQDFRAIPCKITAFEPG